MRFFRRSLIGLFLLAVTVGLLAVGGNTVYRALEARWADEPSQRPARERVFSVRVTTIEPGEITPELTSFGEVRSRRTLDLRAPLGGTVLDLADNFQEGGSVQKGQLLARIDPVDMQAAMDVARTDLIEAEADLLEAQRGIELAKDELEAARTQAELRTRANTEIFARFDGRLSDVAVSAGRLVANNERLAQLVDPLALEVAFRVSTSQYTRLIDENGALISAPVEIRMDVLGTDLVAEGRLTRESAAVAEGTTGRLLFAEVSNPKGLRPGDFVTVVSKEPALSRVVLLPSAAVGPDQSVLLIGEEDRLELARVEVLRRQGELDDDRRARIIAFVEANTRIPDEVKTRMLGQLQEAKVPAQMVARIESRMGS